jgi:pyruvate-formate lyase-activating enzyme
MDKLYDLIIEIYLIVTNRNRNETLTIDCIFPFSRFKDKKMILRFLRAFSKLHDKMNKCSIRVIWNYSYQDGDLEELGEILAELTDITFEFVQFDGADEIDLAGISN